MKTRENEDFIDYDLTKLDVEDYNKRIPYVEDNFNRVKEYDILDDWIYKKFIKK